MVAGITRRWIGRVAASAFLSATVLSLGLIAFIPAHAADPAVTAVRYWSLGEVTRIAVETNGPFEYRLDRLTKPDRVFFDLIGLAPVIDGKRLTATANIQVGDPLLKQIRVAETRKNVTRVVLDLNRDVDFNASRLANPDRLMIEVRAREPAPPQKSPAQQKSLAQQQPPAQQQPRAQQPPPAQKQPPVQHQQPVPSPNRPGFRALPSRQPAQLVPDAPVAGSIARNQREGEQDIVIVSVPDASVDAINSKPPILREKAVAAPKLAPPERPTAKPSHGQTAARKTAPAPVEAPKAVARPKETVAVRGKPLIQDVPASIEMPPEQDESAAAFEEELPSYANLSPPKPADRTSRGTNSLIRAMGLKVGRIVVDPGHGGHDTGTIGKSGLAEKDITLDLAKRLGALIEERLGYEVIYTRTDDRFVSLTERTRLANEKKADLFLSVHVNSSHVRQIAGTETFYLSLTQSAYSLDIAARENANSEQSVHELQDLIRKITLTEKIEESREFAINMQAAMHGELGRAVRAPKDRGVKKAPFLVLIGATMPSILVEVGFLSNAREELLFRRPDHRQTIAEALFDGVSRYASTLGRSEVANRVPASE